MVQLMPYEDLSARQESTSDAAPPYSVLSVLSPTAYGVPSVQSKAE